MYQLTVPCLASLPFLLMPPVLAAAGQAKPPSPPIGQIEVVSYEVFEERSGRMLPVYRLANNLHIRSKEHVIRRELLFASGDPLVPELLAQTERNLRALPFLRDARIDAVPLDSDGNGSTDVVNVRVSTWDAWTTSPLINVGRIAERTTWKLGVAEASLFGLGKEAEVSRRKDLDRHGTTYYYRDRQLAGSRSILTALAIDQSDGRYGGFALERPFFSLLDRWAFALRGGGFDRQDRLFNDGVEVDRLRHVARFADVELSRALTRQTSRATRLHAAYRLRDDRVESDVRDFGVLEVGLSSVEQRFIQLAYVNRFERTEDVNLGAASSATLGISPGKALFFLLADSRTLRSSPRDFLFSSVYWSGRRRQERMENAFVDSRLRYLWKPATRHTFVGNAVFQHGYNLDPEVQLLLGAESGLRGYPVRTFSGTRLLLLSAEQRWFAADDVWQLASLGLSAFADSGFVWHRRERISLSDLKTSVGIGLLVGRNRLSNTQPTLRLDLAYALDPSAGTARWVFTSGSAVKF